jgi:hypothetical protein
MPLIREIVCQALSSGFLTCEAENQLRYLLQHTKYEQEDLQAFMLLQRAAMAGRVVQESRLPRLPEDGANHVYEYSCIVPLELCGAMQM